MRGKGIIIPFVAIAFIAFCVVPPANAVIDPITIGLILGCVFVAAVAAGNNQNDTAEKQASDQPEKLVQLQASVICDN